MTIEMSKELEAVLWPAITREIETFLQESLTIEGIYRDPTDEETTATMQFLHRPLNIQSLITLQEVYAPNCPMRTREGMNVRVGQHIAPKGGKDIRKLTEKALAIEDPWTCHVAFEYVHPFMDGNGHTGRTVWAWKMRAARRDPFTLPFLHRFYYQTLHAVETGKA